MVSLIYRFAYKRIASIAISNFKFAQNNEVCLFAYALTPCLTSKAGNARVCLRLIRWKCLWYK